MFNPRPFAAAALTLVTVLAGAALTALPAQATEPPQPSKPAAAAELPLRDASPQSASAQVPTDQFIVGLKSRGNIASEAAVTAQAARSAAGRVGTAAQYVRATATGAQVVKTGKSLQGADADTFLAALRSSPDVAYAEPDTIVQATATAPNDPGYVSQWSLWDETAGIRIPGAWDYNRGEGAVVAVVDSGITYHSDLTANVLAGYDMLSNPDWARDGDGRDPNPQDQGDWSTDNQCEPGLPASRSSWHGTHVAGTIAAVGNNSNGIIGAAPAAKILPIRAIGPCGGYISDVADSIIWAAGGTVSGVPANPRRAHVVNLSLGGVSDCSVTEQNAINFAQNAGTAVVVAAGNSGHPASEISPANCQNVITVAASGLDGARADYSNYGSAVDITAPGGSNMTNENPWTGIVSTSNFGSTVPEGEAYELLQGTSMAAPHVSAIAAMLISEVGSTYTPDMVEARLKATARPLPVACPEGCGAGLVDAAKALALTNQDLPANTVIPAAVTFSDKDGTADDTLTVPEVQGVEYVGFAGSVFPAGIHTGSGTVNVFARSIPGYTLMAGANIQWSHTYATTSAPVAGSLITVTPFRALDTRTSSIVAKDSTVSFQVAGRNSIPAKVSAVVFNLTVAEARSFGFVTAYASGTARPDASNLNFDKGQIVANSVTVPVGADGKVTLFNRSAGATHLLADISGYYREGEVTAPGAFKSIEPKRFLDTRSGTAVAPDTARAFQVAGANGLPETVSAVVLNLTVAEAKSNGFVTAYPTGVNRPDASNINFAAGQIIPNSVTVPVGPDGKVMLYNRSNGATHLIADVSGYYLSGTPTAGGTFQPLAAPTRFLDTRLFYPLAPDDTTSFQAAREHGIPAGATAIVMNLTVAQATSNGFVTAFPVGATRPDISSVNFDRGQIVANSVTTPIFQHGGVALFNRSAGITHLIADVSGYFLPG
ncbi:serine protease [Pseudarthrobacter equi]|uniref:Serine protease n=1 Tax=Pseudarthrobacter equi TaxID=728066 RepID=A0A1H2B1U5_9MICC|nr:S8 family peptidase [Pseudarthrobacter equi]SDT52052.1 serine protease [Pseudarthrobacter equi]